MRFGCSRATSPPRAGCSARDSSLAISQNEQLFKLIGTTYGGDGESTFALPDLRGRVPMHQGNGFILAETGGAEEVTLTTQQMPAHTHPLLATTAVGTAASPQGSVLAASGSSNVYRQGPGAVALSNQTRRARRWLPAAHELPAVSVRRLHHRALRALPDPI